MSDIDKDSCNKDKMEYASCSSCGAEFTGQGDLDKLRYSRTTASGDHYYCSICDEENVCVQEGVT